ncbi:hypothetical protein [Methyloversatilis sp.]|uniref:hypothetical protein n=1 Tax=Methyloversatilis sp. TaxID=2569862 RepID=UPI003D2D33A7
MKRNRARARRDKKTLHGSNDVDLTRRRPHEEGLSLPYERDESPDEAAGSEPRAIIDQAARDVARGLVDTDRRGTPSDVPGPPVEPGQADVSGEGVDAGRFSHTRRPGREQS